MKTPMERIKELETALSDTQIFMEQLISYKTQRAIGNKQRVSNQWLVTKQFEKNQTLLTDKQ